MGYVFDFNDAVAYEAWYKHSRNKATADLGCRLMVDMLGPTPGETVLDIGCGTGTSLRPFVDMGLSATGIEPSPYMLDFALKNLGHRVDLHRGYAEDLPFADNSFNYACLVTTLEFVEDKQKAIAEASRVAKDKLFIGVLNRYAVKNVQRRIKGVFTKTIYNRAHFFSIWELKTMINALLGEVPVSWRTSCQLPKGPQTITSRMEQFSLLQKLPFGTFAGMVVTLIPRFRTRPLSVRYKSKQTTGVVAG